VYRFFALASAKNDTQEMGSSRAITAGYELLSSANRVSRVINTSYAVAVSAYSVKAGAFI
jgi:hypothetical protein